MTFEQYLSRFNKTWAALVALVSAAPWALLPIQLAPPWPSQNGAASAAIATVAALAGIVFAYLTGNRVRRDKNRGHYALALSCLALLGYLASWSIVCIEWEQEINGVFVTGRIVVGLIPIDGAAGMSAKEIFSLHNLDGWTSTSLLAARVLINALFSLIFFLLTYGFGSIIFLIKSDADS